MLSRELLPNFTGSRRNENPVLLRSRNTFRSGLALARRHDAHLTALFVIDAIFPYYSFDSSYGHLGWNGAETFFDEFTTRTKEAAREMQAKLTISYQSALRLTLSSTFRILRCKAQSLHESF